MDLSKPSFMAGGGKVAPMKIDIDLRAEAKLNKNDGDARAYVLGNGRQTGYEYLYAYDAKSGKVLATHTDRKINAVSTPDYLEPVLNDRSRSIVIHHNHPNNAPPSIADVLSVGSYGGIEAAFIHGHDGSLYKINPLQRGNIEKATQAMSMAAKIASRSPEFASLSDSEYTWLIGTSRLSALSKAGFIQLSSNVVITEKIKKMTDFLVVAALQSIK